MNIFMLSNNPKLCSRYHCDKHVVKMICESHQMLANAFTLDELQNAPKTKERWLLQTTYKKPKKKYTFPVEERMLKTKKYWYIPPQYRVHSYLHHPCSKWTLESIDNFIWLYQLSHYLLQEYTYRYNKIHFNYKFQNWIKYNLYLIKKRLPNRGITSSALAMPDEFKQSNDVRSYRQYYIHQKLNIAKWTRRKKPSWII